MGEPVLEVTGVSKSFGQQGVLRPTSLVLEEGRTMVLLGPSGCGKTTLLRLVLGLTRPDTGSVRFRGIELTPETVRSLRTRMGYVVQDGGLFPHLTAAENVALMARHLGREESWIAGRMRELAALARLPADALDRFPAQLSGGQRQRVGLMRALMLDPELLLMDEPLAAIDPLVRAELQDDLAAAFRSLQKSVLLVTHDLGEAAFFADVLVLMRDGVIVQQGTFRDLVEAPADPFVTRFVRAQRRLAGADGGPAA